MSTYNRNIIIGVLSGSAGVVVKFIAQSVINEINLPRRKTPIEEDNPKTTNFLSLGLGILGGIGTHFAFKKQDRLVTKVASGFVIGSMSDILLKAAKIKEPKQNKKFTMLLGNSLYGFATAMVDKALKQFLSETNHLDNYIEYMQVREDIKKRKTRLEENDLLKTS